jgi:hypothetical protein
VTLCLVYDFFFVLVETGSVKATEGLLEDFNVRVFYDKLEDQNLHLAAQLARQKEDNQVFYNKMLEQVQGLRDLLLNMDPDKFEELERKLEEREARLKRDGLQGAGMGAGPTIINANVGIGDMNKSKFSGTIYCLY